MNDRNYQADPDVMFDEFDRFKGAYDQNDTAVTNGHLSATTASPGHANPYTPQAGPLTSTPNQAGTSILNAPITADDFDKRSTEEPIPPMLDDDEVTVNPAGALSGQHIDGTTYKTVQDLDKMKMRDNGSEAAAGSDGAQKRGPDDNGGADGSKEKSAKKAKTRSSAR
jgi:hypothetical protein